VKKESKAREVWHYPLICLDVEADAVYMPYQEHDLARSSKIISREIVPKRSQQHKCNYSLA
jgi:ureidoglycolate hydrolase